MKLKPFQEVGRDFLAARQRALLADEMRLGKTPQAIMAAKKIRAKRILVLCPAIAQAGWRKMFADWWPGQYAAITSYDKARLNRKEYASRGWDVLILDESHYLKNWETARTRAVFSKGGIAWNAQYIWALSGTPAPNHIGELWPLLRAFGVTRLSYWSFVEGYCRVTDDCKIVGTRQEKAGELREMLKPIMLRRLKSEVASELPPCTVAPYYVEPRPEYLGVHRPVHTDAWADKHQRAELALRKEIVDMTPDAMLAYLSGRQAELASLRRYTALLKAPALVDTLRFELDLGELDKVVVFGYHVDALRISFLMMKEYGFETRMLYGGTPEKKRERMISSFNSPRTKQCVLFAQIIAAGTAIDLSAAHDGILLDRDWVPGNNMQALERMGGYNQKHPIYIRDFIIPGSVDEIVARVVNRKMAELGQVFG